MPDMQLSPKGRVTQLLESWHSGEKGADERLMSEVYCRLERLAAHHLSRERSNHTLEPSALVHEAYLRLTSLQRQQFNDRAHFFAIATRMMRRILVDHERRRSSLRRGGPQQPVPLEEDLCAGLERAPWTDLDEALKRLAKVDPRQATIVDLRFFSGLTLQETAEALGCSPRTVAYDWKVAKAWLLRELV